MDIVTTCPKCRVELLVAPEAENKLQVCPKCQHSFVATVADTSAGAPTGATRRTRAKKIATEVSVLLAAALAIPPTVLVYAACAFGPQDSQVVQILLSGKWVNVVSVFFASWAAMILLLKRFALARQRRALRADLVPLELGQTISSANVERFARHAEELDARLPGTFAIRRTQKLLRFYATGRTPQEVAGHMRAAAEADAQTLESSYVFVKVLIWAIPIMGFIGTVLGIGESVHGFSDTMQGAQQLEVIRTSLGNVTTGLAVAFNTTLVALVLSLCVMFPMSALQRADERLLGDIDDDLDERLLSRLKSEKQEEASLLDLFRESLADQARARASELAELRAALDRAVREMGRRVLEAWSHVDDRLEHRERLSHDRAETLVAAFESSARALFDELVASGQSRASEARSLIGELSSVGQRIEADAAKTYGAHGDLARQALIEAQQAVLALRERDQEENRAIAETLARSAQELERVTGELARESRGSASSIGELIGELSRKLLTEAQQTIASLREKDRDDFREIVLSLETSAQEMERATSALAREASGSAAQIVTVVSEQSRKAAIEAQHSVSSLRERDRDEQKEIARTIQRAAAEMERAGATLAKETAAATAQITAMFRQMNIGLEGQAKTLVSGMTSQLERQTRELSALQRGLADGLAAFQSSLRTLESELGSAIRDARARVEHDEQRTNREVAAAWAAAQQTIEASTRAFETHAQSSTEKMRELVQGQEALVAAVATQFSSALGEHRAALGETSARELGAVVAECKNIVTALGRSAQSIERESERADARRASRVEVERPAPREQAPAAPREPVQDAERISENDAATDGDGVPTERPRPVQAPRAPQLPPRKALQPRTSKPKSAPPAPPVPPANGASEPKTDRTGFWRRFWLGS